METSLLPEVSKSAIILFVRCFLTLLKTGFFCLIFFIERITNIEIFFIIYFLHNSSGFCWGIMVVWTPLRERLYLCHIIIWQTQIAKNKLVKSHKICKSNVLVSFVNSSEKYHSILGAERVVSAGINWYGKRSLINTKVWNNILKDCLHCCFYS